VTFTDETTVASDKLAIRAVNAGLVGTSGSATSLPPVDFGVTSSAGTYQPIVTNVAYPGAAAAGGAIDANGYTTVPVTTLPGASALTICPAGQTPASAVCQLMYLPAGQISGGLVIGTYAIGISGTPPNMLLCVDNMTLPSPSNGYSPCTTQLLGRANYAIYWEFERSTFIDGVTGSVPYDALVNWPPGTGNRSCPEAGVDFVDVTDTNGILIAAGVPCVNQSVQGFALSGSPGTFTYVVTGWRTGQALPLYRGQVTVSATSGGSTFGTAVAAGISDALTVGAILADAGSPLGYATCGLAGIDEFQGWITDGFGTLVWRNPVTCMPYDVPGISFGPVDRDDLNLWMDAIDNRVSPPDIHWSRCGYAQPHFYGVEDRFSLALPLGACADPPPP
jgi:hypothetical protein